MERILNATPGVLQLAVDDRSGKVIFPTTRGTPQYLTKSYILAKKGLGDAEQISGPEALVKYGVDTFDKNKKWMNHSTAFAMGSFGAAGEVVVQRIIPNDATKSKAVLYIDVLEKDVPTYERNADGTYKKTEDGLVETGTTSGVAIKYIVDYTGSTVETKTGILTGGTMYPILELEALAEGEYYDNIGFSLSAVKGVIKDKVFADSRILPYELTLVNKETSVNEIDKTLAGELNTRVSLKQRTVDPLTKKIIDLKDLIFSKYSNSKNPLLPLRYSDFSKVVVHDANIEAVLTILATKEIGYINTDLTASGTLVTKTDFKVGTGGTIDIESEKHVLDLFNLTYSNKVPFHTIVRDESVNATAYQDIKISLDTPIFLKGGTDGNLSNVKFEEKVTTELNRYLDGDDIVQNFIKAPESVMVDSGYGIAVKEAMCNFIAKRKDTFVILSTYITDVVYKDVPLSTEVDIASVLETRLKFMPESTWFGTPVMRGAIVGGYGQDGDYLVNQYLPQAYDLNFKATRYMGAGNGKWVSGRNFAAAPGNIITTMLNLKPEDIPESYKPLMWDKNIIWSQNYDKLSYHCPAYQTVYNDDTSVLNSIFTALAICTIERAAVNAWREFTGTTDKTEAQFAEDVVEFIDAELSGRFDNNYIIRNEVVFTNADKDRGYSWELITRIGAGNMKTVMTHRIEAYRFADLP